MIRTVSLPIKLLISGRFFKLMKQCAEIFNLHVEWALENKTCNKTKAHKALYFKIRELYPEVPSALIQTMRDVAFEAVKRSKFKQTPRKKEDSALRYDVRTLSLRGQLLTLSSLGDREKIIISIPAHFKPICEEGKLKGGTLVYDRRKKQFWIKLVYELPDPPLKKRGKVLGIDRGIHYEAATSEGTTYSSKQRR